MFKPLILSLTAWLVLAACGPAPTQTTQASAADTEASSAANSHTSANSLDWAGVYKGVLPCADCEGVETFLTLNMDNSYLLKTTYLGKDNSAFQQQGKFEWDDKGSVIRLLNQKDAPASYKVTENQLIQLDMEGQLITGNLAESYKLNKQMDATEYRLTGVRWKLTELMGQAVPATEPDMTPYLQFDEENRVSGFAGATSLPVLIRLKA